jgi:hypothetical protein
MRPRRKFYGKRSFIPIRKDGDIDDDIVDEVNDALGADEDSDDEAPSSTAARHASDMADLICESSGTSRADALNWLLHSSQGRTLLLRTLHKRQQTKKGKAMTYNRADEWAAIVKQYGPIKLAKFLVDEPDKATAISEHEFVKACGKDFVKLYTAQDDDGLVMRKAVDLIKQAQFTKRTVSYPDIRQPTPATLEPRVSGGRAAQDVNNPVDAYSKIEQLAKEQRRTFVEVYTDPVYRDLAELERRQARDKLMAGLPLMPT